MTNMTNTERSTEGEKELLAKKQHVRFFQRILNLCPASLASYDTSRLTVAFFAISGLDVLNSLDIFSNEQKTAMIDWIYGLQILPEDVDNEDRCGFQGSTTHKIKGFDHGYERGHLAMTYTGLATLLTLGDELSRVNKKAVLANVKSLQQNDGSFCGTKDEESDMRFVYCAACICYILNDFSAINIPKMIDFIKSSLQYDGGLAQGPELESHGGSTFCGIAALHLCGALDKSFDEHNINKIKKWCLNRQSSGFQGRPNKPVDTCYSFWIGGALKILDAYEMVNFVENRKFIMSTQDKIIGGLAKWPDGCVSDPLHTYLGLCGLSLMNEEGLCPVHPSLNITERAYQHLKKLQQLWASELID